MSISRNRFLSDVEAANLRRRLRTYSEIYPDSEFLDDASRNADASSGFTREYAEKVDAALRRWEQRLNSSQFDPGRCPPGNDPHIWKLAGLFREEIEKHGLWCQSRRMVHAELARVVKRDNLTGSYEPWRDKPEEPGWYRMLRDAIREFTRDLDADQQSGYLLLAQLCDPGVIPGIIEYLKDQAKLQFFDARAKPANAYVPTPERRAEVKAYIQSRKDRRTWT